MYVVEVKPVTVQSDKTCTGKCAHIVANSLVPLPLDPLDSEELCVCVTDQCYDPLKGPSPELLIISEARKADEALVPWFQFSCVLNGIFRMK